MDLWEEFWKKDRNQSLIYRMARFIPAGPWDLHWRWKRYDQFLNEIHIMNPRILELGCGTGVMTFKMLEKLGGEAILLDNSESALRMAKEYSKSFDIDQDRVTYETIDLFRYKPSEGFDIVHSQGLIEHFPDQSVIIDEHYRFAKKGGYVLILAPRPSIFYRTARKTYELFKGEWIFGYENPMHTKKVVKLMKRNNTDIIKKRNFIFSMGCLARKL